MSFLIYILIKAFISSGEFDLSFHKISIYLELKAPIGDIDKTCVLGKVLDWNPRPILEQNPDCLTLEIPS